MKVGSDDAMKDRLDDVNIEIHCLNEPDHTMMSMSSYGKVLWKKLMIKKSNLE